jgi:hypothetical protein
VDVFPHKFFTKILYTQLMLFKGRGDWGEKGRENIAFLILSFELV